MTTISASSTIGIVLAAPTYVNPVYIGPSVIIISSTTGYALYGTSGTAWTITNQGTIEANGPNLFAPAGIELGAGGSVTNQSSAVITGYSAIVNVAGAAFTPGVALTVVNAGLIEGTGARGDGISSVAGGLITNLNGAVISGATGILDRADSMTVSNMGTIEGSGTTGFGVALDGGGLISNASAGTISSPENPVYFKGAPGTLLNAGIVLTSGGSHSAVVLKAGGYVSNAASGTINSNLEEAVYITGGAGTVVNAGAMKNLGGAHTAVALELGGYVANRLTGTITGSSVGVYITGGVGTVVNAGVVAPASTKTAIRLAKGGFVSNAATGTIGVGTSRGVYIIGGAGTVINAGSILSGTSADAVQFVAGYANRLVVDPGAVFSGTVGGGNTIGSSIVSTLELASASSTGTLTGLGTQFIDFAQTMIDAGAAWTFTSSNYLTAGTTLTNLGTLTAFNGTLTGAGLVINNGTIIADPSTLTFTSLTGTGDVIIDSGSTVITTGTVGAGETIVFSGGNGELDLAYTGFSGEISGFNATDRLGLTGITDGTSASVVNGNTLQIDRSAHPAIDLILDPKQDYTGLSFAIGPDGGISEQPVCFLAGTHIATPDGEVPVERLAAGDRVLTQRGAARPIIWIGTGRVPATRGRRSAATPVIVRKGALAGNVPNRDLRITKAHALFLDGVLVPIEFLVNHRTILWDDHAQEVSIYHIELDTHDVLLANGAPAESYRDDGNRWLFQNANTGWGLPPQKPCAPVLTGGPLVNAIWQRLLDRAGPRPNRPLTEDADLHMLTDGRRLDAAEQSGDIHVFRLTTAPASLRLVSRAAVPAELGLARDPRLLGVALRRLVVRKGTKFRVTEARDSRLDEGFHAFEAEPNWRWTDGDAAIPASLWAGFAAPFELLVNLGGRTRYLADGCARAVA
jgi:hypothetical protein